MLLSPAVAWLRKAFSIEWFLFSFRGSSSVSRYSLDVNYIAIISILPVDS